MAPVYMNNNKGFTLIELLGVLVVLVTILLIAIPSIFSTFERNKIKIDERKKKIIYGAAEIYANKHKEDDSFDYSSFLDGTCGININKLVEDNLLTEDEIRDSEGNDLFDNDNAFKVKYNKDGTYSIDKDVSGCAIEQ